MEVCPQPCPAPADTTWLILHLFSLPLTTSFSPQVLPHPTEKLCTALCPECSQVQHGLPEGVRGEHCPGQGAGSPATATRTEGAWGALTAAQIGGHPKNPSSVGPVPQFPCAWLSWQHSPLHGTASPAPSHVLHRAGSIHDPSFPDPTHGRVLQRDADSVEQTWQPTPLSLGWVVP